MRWYAWAGIVLVAWLLVACLAAPLVGWWISTPDDDEIPHSDVSGEDAA